MAISIRAAGSWAYAASGSVTTTLPTHDTGDMLLVRVGYKSSAIATCAASTATSGWAKLGEFHDGTLDSANNTGSVAVAVFWKIALSAAEPNPTIDFSQAQTQCGHVALSYQKGATEGFSTPVGDGGGYAAGTNISATVQSHVSVTANDMVDFFHVARDNATATVPTITQAGVTYGTVSEQPGTAGTDLSGHDGAYDGGYRLASSGTSSAAAVITGTLDTSETGSAWMTRLRVSTATSANAEVATATAAAANDTANIAAGGTGVSAATLDAYVATGVPGTRGLAEYANLAGAGLDATASVSGGTSANAEVATATFAALIVNANIAASLGYARGRSA